MGRNLLSTNVNSAAASPSGSAGEQHISVNHATRSNARENVSTARRNPSFLSARGKRFALSNVITQLEKNIASDVPCVGIFRPTLKNFDEINSLVY